MATFVVLYKYTEQGIRNIKDAPKRVEAAKKAAAKAGITIKETLWLQGEYDFSLDRRGGGRIRGDRLQHQRPQTGQRSHPHHARLHG